MIEVLNNNYLFIWIMFISKYDLLNIIKEVFNKKIEIIPKEIGENRCLVGNIKTNNIKTQLLELKNFYYDN